MINHQAIWELCRSCASHFPCPDTAARLLFGTAAQESNLIYRRQLCFANDTTLRGGFSLWQLEPDSVLAGIRQMATNADCKVAAVTFLRTISPICVGALDVPSTITPLGYDRRVVSICHLMMTYLGDPLGVLFSRLHYLRMPGSIPDELTGQAFYWKKFYNTSAGKGTVEQYLKNWRQYCEPVIGAKNGQSA